MVYDKEVAFAMSVNTITHSLQTLTLSAAQIQSISVTKNSGNIVCKIIGSITHTNVLDIATSFQIMSNGSLTYTANSSQDTVTNTFLSKITSNEGLLVLKNMYKAPSVNGNVKLEVSNVNGSLSWADNNVININESETITDSTTDVHILSPSKSYQWQRNTGNGFTNIANATSLSYTTTSEDVGYQIRMKAFWNVDWLKITSNGIYDTTQPPLLREVYTTSRYINSKGIGIIMKDGNAAASNNVVVGDILSLSVSDSDGLSQTPTLLWKRNNVSLNIRTATYTLTPADFGYTISVVFTYTDSNNNNEVGVATLGTLPSITASYENNIQEFNANEALPNVALSKNATAQSSQWFSYPHNGNKNNSTVYTQNKIFGQSGTYFYKRLTTSGGVIIDSIPLPVKSYAPSGTLSINGLVVAGQTLSLSSSIKDTNYITSNNADGSISVNDLSIQWYRSDNNAKLNKSVIGNSSTYSVTQADASKFIHVEASYTDGNTSHSVSSASVAGNIDGQISISLLTSSDRSISVAKMITGDKIKAVISDADGISGNVTYTWKRGTSTILQNVTSTNLSNTYTLNSTDFSNAIHVRITYTDSLQRTQTLNSSSVSLGEEPQVSLTNNNDEEISGSLASPIFLKVAASFVGLQYKIFVDNAENGSGTISNATGTQITIANAEGKIVYVKVYRHLVDGSLLDPVTTTSVKIADANISLVGGVGLQQASIGDILQINTTNINVAFVEYFFNNVIQSHGTLGNHILMNGQMGRQLFAEVQDVDGYVIQTPTYTLPN